MANKKYTICNDPNLGISSLSLTSGSFPLDPVVGMSSNVLYDSEEEMLANELPRDVIMNKPNVVAAFAGTKFTNGINTGEPCIVVGVTKKTRNIKEKDKIPKIVGTQTKTDIVEMDEIVAIGTCTDGSGNGCPDHDDKHRPLKGGISAIEETSTACTLGVVVKDASDNKLIALTNNHCVGLLYDPAYKTPTNGSTSVIGNSMMQPSPSDGGVTGDIYGTVKRAVAIKFGTDSDQNNIVDCAVSIISTDDASTEILDINDGPFPFALKTEYNAGTEVHKSGRTTGHTPPPETTIISKNANVNVSYGSSGDSDVAPFTNQILYQAGSRFSQGGDSGSALLAVIEGQYKVIGLHFAGNTAGTTGVACHIDDVKSSLSVESWDGSVVVADNPYDAIKINETCYGLDGDTADEITHTIDESYSSCNDCLDTIQSSSSESESSSSNSSSSSSSSIIEKSSSSTEIMSSSQSSSDSTQIMSTSSSSKSSSSSSSESSSSSSIITKSSSSSSSSSSSLNVGVEFTRTSPKDFTYEVLSNNEIKLTWNENISKVSGFSIERKEGYSDWSEIYNSYDEIIGVQTASPFIDSNTDVGKFYNYRIRGLHVNAQSGEIIYTEYSYLEEIILIPIVPEDLIAELLKDQIQLYWEDASKGESGFVVERKTDSGPYSTIFFGKENMTSFIDVGPFADGKTYTYRVSSFVILSTQKYLYSSPSNENSVVFLKETTESSDGSIILSFGQTTTHSVDLNCNFTATLNNSSEDETYLWFSDDEIVFSASDDYAVVHPVNFGNFTMKVVNSNSEEAKLILSVNFEKLNLNPSSPINLVSSVANESSINLFWDYNGNDSNNVSHYEIYRNTNSKVINYSDLSENKIAIVNKQDPDISRYTDYGLKHNTRYYYVIAVVTKQGKTSLLNGNERKALVFGESTTDVKTANNSGYFSDPSIVFVEPNKSDFISINNSINEIIDFDDISWVASDNNSNSKLSSQSDDYIYFEASDKWPSEDIIQATLGSNKVNSRVIITKKI